MSKKALKEAQAASVEKKLYEILGDVDEETMVSIMKKYFRTKNTVVKKGGCPCQKLEEIRGGFIKKLLNKASVGVQNVIRKSNQKNIDNLRLLASGEGTHIPTTNYCGPGTNLEEADKYGIVNHKIYGPIDSICQTHDHDYENASKENDKEKRKKMIMDADELMLKSLEELPDELKSNATFKASKYGIALKNGFEKLTGKMLYGGFSSFGGSKIGGSPNYDVNKIIKYIVRHNITDVKKIENLGKAKLVDSVKEERKKKLAEVQKKKEDDKIKKLTEVIVEDDKKKDGENDKKKDDEKNEDKKNEDEKNEDNVNYIDYIPGDNVNYIDYIPKKYIPGKKRENSYIYHATLNSSHPFDTVKFVEIILNDNSTGDEIYLKIPFVKDGDSYKLINTVDQPLFEDKFCKYFSISQINELDIFFTQGKGLTTKYLTGLFNLGMNFTIKTNDDSGKNANSMAKVEATLNIEHLLAKKCVITSAKETSKKIDSRKTSKKIFFTVSKDEIEDNQIINYHFIKSKIQ